MDVPARPRSVPLPRARRLLPRGAVVRGAVLAVLLLLICALPVPAGAEGPRWLWPVPAPHPVLAGFEAPLHEYGPGHRGIDIGTGGPGTEVRAVEAGVVRFRGSIAGRGVVSVLHADGLISTYEPVSSEVDAGDRVETGTVIGVLEDAGSASHCPGSVCLHLGARQGDVYRDPLPLLGARGPSVLLPWEGGGGAAVPAGSAGGSSAARAGSPGARLASGGVPSAVPGVRRASAV